ncbi:Hypothetical protein bglu_1g20850 [Burkholderia glumae BGR1]|nr:Hypothetical protein bglu_1g20850 [Burkholderia glumae BGR1]
MELAAKAAEIEILRSRLDDPLWRDMLLSPKHSKTPGIAEGWNPLTDDGDALRLAVKLRMDIDISINAGYVSVTAHREPDERVFIVEKPGDSAEALRRAITRAAAEIARTTDTGGEA